MSERRHPRHNPYQLPFDFGTQPLEISQHVRILKEPYALRTPADAAEYLMTQMYFPLNNSNRNIFACC